VELYTIGCHIEWSKKEEVMITRSKIKWVGTILVAGIALALALMGGKWGTSYAADAGVNVAPTIDEIDPHAAPVGSSSKFIVITGSNFGSVSNTAVRVKDTTTDISLTPVAVLVDGLIVNFPASLFTSETVYQVTVVIYSGTIPTIPPFEESNSLPFVVFIPRSMYFPVISK
jgi:hypothetical protein